MTYGSAQAFRAALETRLRDESERSGVALVRLRRRVMFERIIARLDESHPGRWVVKGGMALEIRLKDKARLTRDIDVGLRAAVLSAAALHEDLVAALAVASPNDWFELLPRVPTTLEVDGAGHLTWRVKIEVRLAARAFDIMTVDISPRVHELDATERLPLPDSLAFAGVPGRSVEVIDVNRHAAEKLHALCRTYGDRENSRVRDLVDIVLLLEHGLIDPPRVAAAAARVWADRDSGLPPAEPPTLPASWPGSYERLTSDLTVEAATFAAAHARLAEFWSAMQHTGQM